MTAETIPNDSGSNVESKETHEKLNLADTRLLGVIFRYTIKGTTHPFADGKRMNEPRILRINYENDYTHLIERAENGDEVAAAAVKELRRLFYLGYLQSALYYCGDSKSDVETPELEQLRKAQDALIEFMDKDYSSQPVNDAMGLVDDYLKGKLDILFDGPQSLSMHILRLRNQIVESMLKNLLTKTFF